MSNTTYEVGVIICAAGKGARMGLDKNKVLLSLNGETVLEKSLRAFSLYSKEIVVTSSKEDFDEISKLCAPFNAKVVLGGATRFESVSNALDEINAPIVLIHDGARPFIDAQTIENCISDVKTYGSGICAIPSVDTISVVDERGYIRSTPDRNTLYQIQTPQGFFTENLKTAYREAVSDNDAVFTDDASVFAKYCGKPHISKGARTNIKITYLEDVKKAVVRCGFGIDTHAFGKEQDYIVLAGVKIPSQSGLVAHSDGDVLVHALMDALLSAAGLKDIGHYFPDTDDKWKNADSMKMLKSVLELIRGQKLCVQNVSIAIQAEKPRLAKYIDEMKFTLANALRIDVARVGITAGTNEGLGYVGEGKGITVNAYVLLNEIG